MSLKTKIKNDMWHINYIIPFTAKYLQGGKFDYLKKSIPVIAKLRVIKGRGKRDISKDILALMQKVDIEMLEDSTFSYWIDEHKTVAVKGNVLSNFSIDYGKLVNGSFYQIADESIAVGGEYGERAKYIKKAITVIRDRTIEVIQNKCKDKGKKDGLVEELKNILNQPAVHFHEGLQRILFFNQYMWQTRHGLNGLGRLDKILERVYREDISKGIITEETAYSMIKDFLNVESKWYSYKSSSLLGDIGQIIILGGLEANGSYFCNDLTYLFLKAQADLKKPDPKTLLRVSSKMPDKLLKTAVSLLSAKTGSPLFSNDDVVIPQLCQFGLSSEDAHNYCVSACWEPFIPGKSLDQNNIKAFDFFKPLDLTLNEIDLNSLTSFEVFFSAYKSTLKREWKIFLNGLNEYVWACDPFVSMMTDGCNKTAKDISEGGAIHSNYGVTSIGMGSACDTLMKIKKVVFEDKKYSLFVLNEIRKNNFKNHNDVYDYLKTLGHSYAHDDEDTIKLVNEIISASNSVVDEYTNPLGGKVKFGLSSPFYIRDAKKSPADLSGRKHGDPYETHISSLDASYTEVVNFAGKIDYSGYAFNGNVIDYFMSPNLIENNLDKFVSFMKAAIQIGFFQMQMNIMDSATLIDAKKNPDQYPGLIVRVWGFSAYFNDLPEEYKDVLIDRAIVSEKVVS